MINHRIRGVSKIIKIRLNGSYNNDLVIDLSSGIKNQFHIILKVKDIIDSYPSYPKTTNQIPEGCQNDNNPEVVDTYSNVKIENSENDINSNNELTKSINNENCIDITEKFNINKYTTEKNKIEDIFSFSSYFEQYESNIGFFDDDDINDIYDIFSDD